MNYPRNRWMLEYFRTYYLTDEEANTWTNDRVQQEIDRWVGEDPFTTTRAKDFQNGWDRCYTYLKPPKIEIDKSVKPKKEPK